MIAGVAVMAVVVRGFSWLAYDQRTRTAPSLLGVWLALGCAAVIMIITANRWARFVPGLPIGAALRVGIFLVFELALGPDDWSQAISRTDLAIFFAYSLIVVLLTFRFLRKRPAKTTFVDRIALTVFVFTALKQLAALRFLPAPLLSGVLALAVAWCADFFTRKKLNGKHRSHQPQTRRMAGSLVK